VASVELFKELARLDRLDFGFQTQGILMLCNSEKGERDEIELAREAETLGVEAKVLTAKQINELDPGIQTCARGGVYYPGDCHMDPGKFVQALSRYVEQKGVKILPSRETLGFERADGKITAIHTSRGRLTADEFVLAGGAWSAQLCCDLGIRLPVQPAKGYSVTIESPPRRMRVPSILKESKVAITPIGEKLRFAGTLELAGLDLSINRRRVDAILNAVPRYLAGIHPDDYKQIQPWAGLRPCSPDGLPFVGRMRNCQNLVAATGHAMLGLSLAPITGKLVAELLAQKKTSIDINLLNPNRFD
jgi:D-amino-acid dehydrogenase